VAAATRGQAAVDNLYYSCNQRCKNKLGRRIAATNIGIDIV